MDRRMQTDVLSFKYNYLRVPLGLKKKKQKRFAHFSIFGPEYEQSQVKGCKQMFVRLHPAAIDLTWVHQAPHLVMGKETDGNKCHKSNIHYVLL